MIDLDKQLLLTVDKGLQADKWLNHTELGNAVKQKAIADQQEALFALSAVNATDSKAVQDLQNKVALPAMALKWLTDIINEGKNAEAELIQRDNTD